MNELNTNDYISIGVVKFNYVNTIVIKDLVHKIDEEVNCVICLEPIQNYRNQYFECGCKNQTHIKKFFL